MQLCAMVLLALAASPPPPSNMTSTNGTNATSSSNETSPPATSPPKNVTSSDTTPETNPPNPPPRSIPDPGVVERTSDRKMTVGVQLPSGYTAEQARLEIYDAVENNVLPAEYRGDVDTIVELIQSSARKAQALSELVEMLISFRDTKTGLSAEETLRRKCFLDSFIADLEKQIADPNSALRKAIPYLTGSGTPTGAKSARCANLDADDDLSGGAIAGIVIGSLVFVGIIAAVVVGATKKPEAQMLPNEPVAEH
eukprot:TRINITY_DN72_c0_g1_i11.p1 TRINITY_DN72_c0_g1~~TRINITY_DN72_c0_g1_i11.p1  ORF type:complete len:254 (+),score=107.75 TRINITY_DN72_c0_g1_i11:61-822(+)